MHKSGACSSVDVPVTFCPTCNLKSFRTTRSETRGAQLPTKVSKLVLYGFSFFGKPFSYLALPLGSALVLYPQVLLRPMYFGLTGHNSLTSVSWALLISLIYGIFGVGYGVLSGYSLVTALQVLSYNLYPFYLFLGIWGGVQDPNFVRKYIRFFAWFGTAFIPIDFILKNRAEILFHSVVGTGFGVLLGIFAFEQRLGRYWLPIVVFSFSLIAHQVRGDWFGMMIALLVWGTATKNLGRISGMIAAIAILLIVGLIFDVHLRAVPGRGGELSTRETVARAVSTVSPELGMEYSSNARAYAGTVSWRKNWWKGIREAVSENYQTMMFGLGYGFPIYILGQGELRNTKSGIRSPHNIFYFVLAYSGVVGLICFFWLEASVVMLLWETYKETGQIFGLIFFISAVVSAFCGNFLETPHEAIPTYLLTGLAIGPLFRQKAQSVVTQRHGLGPVQLTVAV